MIDIYYSRVACNCYIMYNEHDEAVLIDPGYSLNGALIDHILKLNKKIKAILITHGHYDHIFALKEVLDIYKDAKVYILKDEAEFLTNPDLNLSNDVRTGIVIDPISYLPPNLIQLEDGEKFNEAGFNIKIIATPFHTKGSSCYLVESEKALFSGDTLFFTTIGRSDLPTSLSKLIPSSLKKLASLSDELKVYPGHGAITVLGREKKYNPYLKNL